MRFICVSHATTDRLIFFPAILRGFSISQYVKEDTKIVTAIKTIKKIRK